MAMTHRAVSRSTLRPLAPSSSGRLTSSTAGKAKTGGLSSRQSRATDIRPGISSRELAALGIDADDIPDAVTDVLGTQPSSEEPRYGLRVRDQTHKVLQPARVTKSQKIKAVREKDVYKGPGYQGKKARITAKGQECSICAETQASHQFPEPGIIANCSHPSKICRTCIARHTETLLSGDGKWRRVQCLECQKNLTKIQISKLIWKEDLERLVEFAKQKADEANPRYRSCLSATCNSGQVHRGAKNPIVTCKECGSRSCFNHRVPWHEDYTCERYEDSHPDAESTRTSEERLKTMAKKCPGEGCGTYIEKEGGCNMMFCSRCMRPFDWSSVQYETPTKKNKRDWS